MNKLQKIIYEEVRKTIQKFINEGISQKLYHFCPINSLYGISESNEFVLTPISGRPSDAKMTSLPIGNGERKQWNYYMCFSRTPSSLAGYVNMRKNKTGGTLWKTSLVRIEVDGSLLQSNYKGMPVNYFSDKNLPKINHNYEYGEEIVTDSQGRQHKIKTPINTVQGKNGNVYSKQYTITSLGNGSKLKQKIIPRYTPHRDDGDIRRGRKVVTVDYGVLDRNQMSEYEDRLFSNKPTIPNAKKYIKQIDIYLNNSFLKGNNKNSYDTLYMLKHIINTFGDIVYIFFTEKDFETRRGGILGPIFSEKYLQDINIEETPQLLSSELKTIIDYICLVSLEECVNWEGNMRNNCFQWIEYLNLPKKESLELVDIFIKKLKTSFDGSMILYLSKILHDEIPKIPIYKQKKYIKPLDEYSGKFSKINNKNIFTLKSNIIKRLLKR